MGAHPGGFGASLRQQNLLCEVGFPLLSSSESGVGTSEPPTTPWEQRDVGICSFSPEFWEVFHQLPGWGRLCSSQDPAVVWNFGMEPSLVCLLSSGSWSWKLFCQDWGSWSGFSNPQNGKWVLKWFYEVSSSHPSLCSFRVHPILLIYGGLRMLGVTLRLFLVF